MIIPFIALFFRSIVLRETKSICNIAHVLIRVSNAADRCQRQKKTKNTIKAGLCFKLGVIVNNTQI